MTSTLKNRSIDEDKIIVDPEEARLMEFEAGVRKGIEDYKAGKVTICHTIEEALEHLKKL